MDDSPKTRNPDPIEQPSHLHELAKGAADAAGFGFSLSVVAATALAVVVLAAAAVFGAAALPAISGFISPVLPIAVAGAAGGVTTALALNFLSALSSAPHTGSERKNWRTLGKALPLLAACGCAAYRLTSPPTPAPQVRFNSTAENKAQGSPKIPAPKLPQFRKIELS